MSTDTQFVHLAWKQNEKSLENVEYLMGADPSGAVSRLFGVDVDGAGLALRGTFLINPEGTLLSSEVSFFNVGRNVDGHFGKFKANLYVAKKEAEACPAQWKDDGDKTLTPGPELVGKVHDALTK